MRSGLDEVARSDERVASARELSPIRHLCKGYLVRFYQIKIAARPPAMRGLLRDSRGLGYRQLAGSG